MKITILKKSISLLLLGGLFFEPLSFAESEIHAIHIDFQHVAGPSWALPESVGTVDESYSAPGSDRTLFLIKEAHTNESGERNISRILDMLLTKDKSFRTVYAEAASGDVSLTDLRNFGTTQSRKQVADAYIRKGLLHGAEYLDLTSGLSFKIVGVEDMALYEKALAAYRNTAQNRRSYLDYLDRIDGTIDYLKTKIWNPSLLTFEESFQKAKKNDISLSDYFEILTCAAQSQGINTSNYHHFSTLKKLREAEAAIDFKKANQEQQKAVASLADADRLELTEYSKNKKFAEKIGLSSHEEGNRGFFLFLKEKLRNQATNRAAHKIYPELYKYFEYMSLAKSLDPKSVLDEKEMIEEQVFDSLSKSEDEKTLLAAARELANLKGLFNLTLQPEEFRKYKTETSLFTIADLTGFLNLKLMELEGDANKALFLEPGVDNLAREAEYFYELTLERDQAFVKNTLSRMSEKNESKAVLVAGGYHAENLKSLFQKAGISYVVITPQVYHETNIQKYEKALLTGHSAPTFAGPAKPSMIGVLYASINIPNQEKVTVKEAIQTQLGARLSKKQMSNYPRTRATVQVQGYPHAEVVVSIEHTDDFNDASVWFLLNGNIVSPNVRFITSYGTASALADRIAQYAKIFLDNKKAINRRVLQKLLIDISQNGKLQHPSISDQIGQLKNIHRKFISGARLAQDSKVIERVQINQWNLGLIRSVLERVEQHFQDLMIVIRFNDQRDRLAFPLKMLVNEDDAHRFANYFLKKVPQSVEITVSGKIPERRLEALQLVEALLTSNDILAIKAIEKRLDSLLAETFTVAAGFARSRVTRLSKMVKSYPELNFILYDFDEGDISFISLNELLFARLDRNVFIDALKKEEGHDVVVEIVGGTQERRENALREIEFILTVNKVTGARLSSQKLHSPKIRIIAHRVWLIGTELGIAIQQARLKEHTFTTSRKISDLEKVIEDLDEVSYQLSRGVSLVQGVDLRKRISTLNKEVVANSMEIIEPGRIEEIRNILDRIEMDLFILVSAAASANFLSNNIQIKKIGREIEDFTDNLYKRVTQNSPSVKTIRYWQHLIGRIQVLAENLGDIDAYQRTGNSIRGELLNFAVLLSEHGYTKDARDLLGFIGNTDQLIYGESRIAESVKEAEGTQRFFLSKGQVLEAVANHLESTTAAKIQVLQSGKSVRYGFVEFGPGEAAYENFASFLTRLPQSRFHLEFLENRIVITPAPIFEEASPEASRGARLASFENVAINQVHEIRAQFDHVPNMVGPVEMELGMKRRVAVVQLGNEKKVAVIGPNTRRLSENLMKDLFGWDIHYETFRFVPVGLYEKRFREWLAEGRTVKAEVVLNGETVTVTVIGLDKKNETARILYSDEDNEYNYFSYATFDDKNRQRVLSAYKKRVLRKLDQPEFLQGVPLTRIKSLYMIPFRKVKNGANGNGIAKRQTGGARLSHTRSPYMRNQKSKVRFASAEKKHQYVAIRIMHVLDAMWLLAKEETPKSEPDSWTNISNRLGYFLEAFRESKKSDTPLDIREDLTKISDVIRHKARPDLAGQLMYAAKALHWPVSRLKDESEVKEKISFVIQAYDVQHRTGDLWIGTEKFKTAFENGTLLIEGPGGTSRIDDYRSQRITGDTLEITTTFDKFLLVDLQAKAAQLAQLVKTTIPDLRLKGPVVEEIDLNILNNGHFDATVAPLLVREIKVIQNKKGGDQVRFLIQGEDSLVHAVIVEAKKYLGEEQSLVYRNENDLPAEFQKAKRLSIHDHEALTSPAKWHFIVQKISEGDVPNLRAILQGALFEASLDALDTTNPEFLKFVEFYSQLLGSDIQNVSRFIAVLSGQEKNPEMIHLYAVPPVERVPVEYLLQAYRLMVKMAEQAA